MNNAIKERSGQPGSRWLGQFEGLHEGFAYGWAFDTLHPDARVAIELCLNGMPVAIGFADLPRGDLAGQLLDQGSADGCHGFAVDMAQIEGDGTLSVRIANHDTVLEGRSSVTSPPAAAAGSVSEVITNRGLRLYGWACDPVRPELALTVRAYLGNELLAEARADQAYPGAQGVVEGFHSFELNLPMHLADGRTHSVRVIDSNGSQLSGSPVAVCCGLHGMRALLPAGTGPATIHLAQEYERYSPRSLAFSQYPQWAQEFDGQERPPAPVLSTAIIIAGASGHEVTQASVLAQAAPVRIFSGTDFPQLLAAARSAGCDLLGVLRAGDTLRPDALAFMAEAFQSPACAIAYSDSVYQDQPWFKPAWNGDYALASDYPLELMLVRCNAIPQGPMPTAASFAWCTLAAHWPDAASSILHVPRVLYEFAQPPNAAEAAERLEAAQAALPAIASGTELHPLPAGSGLIESARRLQPVLDEQARQQMVSLLIPTRDHAAMLRRCIDSLRRFTDWPQLEIIIMDNGSTEPETLAYFSMLMNEGVRILPMPGVFNYADLNNRAVAQARGSIVGLLNNDIEALHPGWLEELLGQLMRPGVGAVGAKLLWPNQMVQHGGVIVGVGQAAAHYGNRLADGDWGDHGRNQLVQEVSGVTGACLFLRKSDYLALGGMDSIAFPVAFNDVDMCLKIRHSGKTVVWTPHARLLHAESASRGKEDTPQKRARMHRELYGLRQRWGSVLMHDPAYHPSLNLDMNSHAFSGLAMPPRARRPRPGHLYTETN